MSHNTWKLRPSPKTAKLIECILHALALEGRPAPPHDCPRWATTGYPCELLGLPRSLPEGGVRLPDMAPALFPNHHAPWQLLAEQGYGAHQAAPEPSSSGDSGGVPPHNFETNTMRGTPTTHTHTNASTRPTTHIEPLYLTSYNVLPQRPGGDITYIGNHITITARKNPQGQTHTCKHKALDPQPHTQGSCHLPRHNAIILPILGTDTEDGRKIKHINICTATRGTSLTLSPTTDPRPPIPPIMRRSPHTDTHVCHSIATH